MKNFKWGYAIAASLVLGMSSCAMEEHNYQNTETHAVKAGTHAHANTNTVKGQTTAAKSSKEPVQKTSPGPKRAAAPQIPVIQ